MAGTNKNTFECFVEGEVVSSKLKPFRNLLHGLFDDSTTYEDFAYRECVFKYDQECPTYIPGSQPSELRVRCYIEGSSLTTGGQKTKTITGQESWTTELRHVGRRELKPKVNSGPVVYRNQVSVLVSDNIHQFMSALGFRLDFGYLRRGSRWQTRDGLILEMTRLKKLEAGALNWKLDPKEYAQSLPIDESAEAIMVEVRQLASDDQIDDACDKVRRFAIDLEPYFYERRLGGNDPGSRSGGGSVGSGLKK